MLFSVMNYLSPSERMLIAARRGCVHSVMKLITQHAADPNSKDRNNGMTALHIASRDGNFAICRYLIKNSDNLKLDEKNDNKQTALFLATLMGVTCIRDTLGRRDELDEMYNPIIKLLTDAGAIVSNTDIDNLKIRNNRKGLEILLPAKQSQHCMKCCKYKN